MSLLTEEHLYEFIETGVVVIENVLSEEEIGLARNGLHEKLLDFGIDHYGILSGNSDAPNSVRIKSEPSKIFYGNLSKIFNFA